MELCVAEENLALNSWYPFLHFQSTEITYIPSLCQARKEPGVSGMQGKHSISWAPSPADYPI